MRPAGKFPKLPDGVQAFNRVYSGYQQNAKNRSRAFEISKDDFRLLSQGSCYYCGGLPSKIREDQYGSGSFTYNGLDRIDSSVGYTLDNVVTCCFLCNGMKSNKDEQDFIEHCIKIANHQRREND